MKDHSRFSIQGTVTSKFVSDSGKFAKLSVSVPVGDGKTRKVDVRAFKDAANVVGMLSNGQHVVVTGDVEMNPLKDKAKADVKVDGYTKWIVELTAREIKDASGAPVKSPPKDALPDEDDQIGF